MSSTNDNIGLLKTLDDIEDHESTRLEYIETIKDKEILPLMVIAISLNICPASSSIKTIGTNTAKVVRVEARTAPQTSAVPS